MPDPGEGTAPRAAARREIIFPPFRLDLDAGLLRAGDRAITLRPKTWSVLCYLAQRPGVLVTKDELLDAVWSGVTVTETTLTKSIGEIRDALHDEVRRPRFVETVHRRGFRFVAPHEGTGTAREPQPADVSPRRDIVGREAELVRLHAVFTAAAAGTRQIAFVTGEAGIGKTTLVDAFLASLASGTAAGETSIAKGQCIRRHSGEEPLMPVLEAVGRLVRGPHAARVVQLLRDRAPGWLVQFPWLVEPGALPELRAVVSGTTAEGMLRVFAQLVEELTTDVTLVLVLEDLHWADASTVDLVSVLAERPERARFLLLGTYRPAEAIARGGAFDTMRRVLALKHCSVELALDLLPPSGVEAYLATRFAGHAAPPALARLLHAQTEGNPLFLVTAVDFLVARGWLTQDAGGVTLRADLGTIERHIPGSLQELVELQVLGLDDLEIAVLEAASVAGFEFGAQAVAAALGVPSETVEDACERLVRSQRFLRASDTEAWPDGAVAARYAFAHAVYQRVLYHRIPAGRRRLLHQKIGERLEHGFGPRAAEVAVELAAHFERGHEPARAITWLASAADAAALRFAPRQAAGYLRRALALLETGGQERRELGLRLSLGAAVIATDGFAAAEAWTNLTRADELAARAGRPIERFHVVYMMANASLARADAVEGPRVCDEIVRLAEEIDTEETRVVATMLSANAALWTGNFAAADGLARVAAADPRAIGALVPGENPVVWAHGADGWRCWIVGRPDAAAVSARAAIACARSQPNPSDLAMALGLAAQVHIWRGDLDDAARIVEEGGALAVEHGLGLWKALLRGAAGALALDRGDAARAAVELSAALEDFRRLGVLNQVPAMLAGKAAVALCLVAPSEALAAIDEGLELVRTTLSRWYAAELWRLKGEAHAARGDGWDLVAESFGQALEIAGAQGARAFELRAATALARRLADRGRAADAHATLAPRYEAFAEGHDTADLRAARAVLGALRA